MNANSPQPTLLVKDWLAEATRQLIGAGIGTAKLDAEIMLAHTLRQPRTYLHAHDDELLDARTEEIANARLDLRLDRVPLAYIIGHKEFYGRRFQVTPSVLIPRPESEAIIDSLKQLLPSVPPNTPQRLVDIGTGSGCLGITAKLEFPEFDVTLLDQSRHALTVARRNAAAYGAVVTILKSNLLAEYPFRIDVCLANLPYVDVEWERSPETNYEPELALFANNHGRELIETLLPQAARQMTQNGLLILEADPVQHAAITQAAETLGFRPVLSDGYALSFQKS